MEGMLIGVNVMGSCRAPRRVRRVYVAALLALASLAIPALQVAALALEPYQEVVDMTFPADPRARFSADYHQPRGGGTRVHRATDIIFDKHSPLYATVDGVICYINGLDGNPPSWGYSLTICGDDGRRYDYLHINNDTPGTDDGMGGPAHAYAPGIRGGVRVARGQLVAYMGDSGNAENTVDHLHFEIEDPRITDPYGSNRIDPYESLRAALARGDVADGSVVFHDPFDRLAGPDRVGTAIELVHDHHDDATHVIIAPAGTPSEPIISGPLAAELHAPVFTSWDPDHVDERVLTEIANFGATHVTLVGHELPDAYRDDLLAAGIEADHINWIKGADRFETAALVAEEVWRLQGAGEALPTPIVAEPLPALELPEPRGLALDVSGDNRRRDPVQLAGATVDGEVFVFLSGAEAVLVDTVAFWVDDVDRLGPAEHVETAEPYDLAGTGGGGGRASAYDTTALVDGTHVITAVVTYLDATEAVVSATFDVNNGDGAQGVDGPAVPAGYPVPALSLSPSSSRVPALALDGAAISGDVYVTVAGADRDDTDHVLFHIDDPEAAGEPHRFEGNWPFDLEGTSGDGTAVPFDTDRLANGNHTLTATVTRTDGEVQTVTATFEVRNVVARDAILALGQHADANREWPDSLMASYYGAAMGAPVLLTTTDDLPSVTEAALDGVRSLTIIGGVAAVSGDVEASLLGVVGSIDRLWGQTRYGTATAVTQDLIDRRLVTADRIWAATGRNWPDAATAGPVVASAGDALVLVDGQATGHDAEARQWLEGKASRADRGRVIGGTAAVNDQAALNFSLWMT